MSPVPQQRLRACIFDLDGTLLYTLPTIHHYCNKSLAHFGLRSISREDCQDLCRLSIAQFYHRLLELGGCPPERIPALAPRIRDYDCAIYLTDTTHLTAPYPGILELLQTLSARGVPIGVLTNKPHALAQSVVQHFFGDLVSVCVGQTPDSISKPDPRAMDAILQTLALARDEAIYVGDTDIDMQTANNANVAAAAVTWGYQPLSVLLPHKPAFVIEHPTDLLTLFS